MVLLEPETSLACICHYYSKVLPGMSFTLISDTYLPVIMISLCQHFNTVTVIHKFV